MTEGKVIDGGVKFEEGALVFSGELNPNKDAENLAWAKGKVSSKEAVEEIFSRAQGGQGQVVVFKPEFSGTAASVKIGLDTDKDGEKVLELEIGMSLLEVTDEVLDAIAAARGKKLVSA